MKIESLTNIKRTKNWRIAIYGKPGVGKTSMANNLSGRTLILALDNSAKVLAGKDIDVIEFDRSKPNQEMIDFCKMLSGIETAYDNLVIDNITTWQGDWFVEKGLESKNGVRNEIQDYSEWTNYFTRVISMIYQSDMNILVTAWEEQTPIQSANGQQFNQYGPKIRASVRDTFMGLTDIVGRILVKVDTGERGIILQGNDGMYAKNRLDNRKGCLAKDLFEFEL